MKLKKYAFLLMLAIIAAISSFAQNDTTATFKVYGACGMCKMRIEKALKIKGISKAKWDVGKQMLTVTYNSSTIQLDAIHSKVAEVGHDTELKKAKDDVYKALPECCLYRDGAHMDDEAAVSEDNVNGMVVSEDKKGNFSPLAGASVYWLGTAKGVTTNEHGIFSIPLNASGKLIVSYTGFRTDTLAVSDNSDLQIVMAPTNSLKEIIVTRRQRSTVVNMNSPIRVSTITTRELAKAACCNLSESFETNPSVDVSYNDAVTGSKQIQLLGISGAYSQLTVENLPGPRGLATPLGLNSIAGPWVESIQLTKGTGSVVNGFESIAGQINVELKKPESMEKLYANGYVNNMGKTDFNLNLAQKIGEKWSTALLLHDDFLYNIVDQNKDGYRDLPTGNQFSAINRWKFDNGKGLMFQLGAKALIDNKIGGENRYNEGMKGTTQAYGLGINTKRYEGFAKIGYVFPGKRFKSIGLQLSAFDHDQKSYFGLGTYDARQKNFYSNLIFQNIIGTTDHKYRAGVSFSADSYRELFKGLPFARNEIVPGAFVEYTYTMNEKFSVVAGLRADHNSLFGWFATPRLNVRYEPVHGTMIRLSAGRGQRTANIFAENMGALVSARMVQILSTSPGKAYGLNPEIAWNKGITIDQTLKMFGRDALISVDFFRNDFSNQVVVDKEDPQSLMFYDLDGKSYSNSFQAEVSATPAEKFDVRLAYRWFDVKTTYSGKLLQKPFTAQHRVFANLAYELKDWKFDYTVNLVGSKRIPSTAGHHDPAHQLPLTSPTYVTMNAQVSKAFGKSKAFEVYLGGENLTNFMQHAAILSADQPFGNQFDASMIWGPVGGRLIYTGFRFKIK
jgi:outer membrane receptor protein involved in Fe transport/copper chaperone CopZ